jgi:predicted dehydrogenase
MAGGRIGYVDLDLDNFHANTYLRLLREDLAERGWAVSGCTCLRADAGRAWARKNGLTYYDSVAEMDAHVDCYAVLAPSNPEVHLSLCEQVFPCRKPTYVDKTFAPDLATAERIFALADRYGVPMQTSSALRYTNVHDQLVGLGRDQVRHMVTWGGGSSFDEYAIHPTELTISCMGPEVERVMRRGAGNHSQLLLDLSHGRTAVVNVYTNANTPFAASVTTADRTLLIPVDTSRIFLNMAVAMVALFATGQPNIDRRESLAIRHVLDLAATAQAQQGFVRL